MHLYQGIIFTHWLKWRVLSTFVFILPELWSHVVFLVYSHIWIRFRVGVVFFSYRSVYRVKCAAECFSVLFIFVIFVDPWISLWWLHWTGSIVCKDDSIALIEAPVTIKSKITKIKSILCHLKEMGKGVVGMSVLVLLDKTICDLIYYL